MLAKLADYLLDCVLIIVILAAVVIALSPLAAMIYIAYLFFTTPGVGSL